jgi:pimeloyl-ACP methyl ester carboxylesterase
VPSRLLLSGVLIVGVMDAAGSAAPDGGVAEVNGTRLHYESRGRGAAIVLVHGGLVDSRQWDDQMAPLARRSRVVRYDLRGFGRSSAPTGPFSPIEDLRALLDFLAIDRASVVGLSLGGIVAAEFALEYPARVDRLVLVGSGLRGDRQPPDEKSLNAYRVGAREGADKYFEAFLESDLLAGVRRRPDARARMRTMMVENFKALAYLAPGTLLYPATPTADRLGDIKAPTLVVIGSLDGAALRLAHARSSSRARAITRRWRRRGNSTAHCSRSCTRADRRSSRDCAPARTHSRETPQSHRRRRRRRRLRCFRAAVDVLWPRRTGRRHCAADSHACP